MHPKVEHRLQIEADGFKRQYRFFVRFSLWQRFQILLGLPVAVGGDQELGAHCFPAPQGETMLTSMDVFINSQPKRQSD